MILPYDVLRCAVRQTSKDVTDIVNVFYFSAQPFEPCPDYQDILDALAVYFDLAFAPIETMVPNLQSPNDIKVDRVELQDNKITVVENIGTVSWGDTYNPSGSGEAYAPGVAALALFRTGVGKILGKKYFGQLTETAIDSGLLHSLMITYLGDTLTALLETCIVDAGTAELVPCLLSTRDQIVHTFTEAEVNPEPAYQRRRKTSVGS